MPQQKDLNDRTWGELTETAREEGIPFVAHMSQGELVEAIEQQREENTHQPPLPRQPSDQQENTGGEATTSS